jgi:hypothetical protein
VVPGVASEEDAGGHQRLDEIELGALHAASMVNCYTRYRDGWIDRLVEKEKCGRPSITITYRVLGIVV